MKKVMYVLGVMIGASLIILSCQKQPQEVKQHASNLKDGSVGTPYQGVDQTAEYYSLKSGHMTLIDFDDLTPGEMVPSDQYAALGVYLYPSSDELWSTNSPCNGSVALFTVPFSGPYFVFNFDEYLSAVSIESGDYGADSDEMTLTAYSGMDGTGEVRGAVTLSFDQGHETGCQLLELTGLQGVRSVTVTSVSIFEADEPLEFPNSIYVDNLTFESAMGVMVDIKPGSYPNTINCTNENGLIPVAILSTDSFDALTIDHTTVTFEGATEWHVKKNGEVKRHEEDVNGDGLMDLVFHFKYMDTNLDCGSTFGGLFGQTYDGEEFYGEDEVTMIEPGE